MIVVDLDVVKYAFEDYKNIIIRYLQRAKRKNIFPENCNISEIIIVFKTTCLLITLLIRDKRSLNENTTLITKSIKTCFVKKRHARWCLGQMYVLLPMYVDGKRSNV